MRRIVVFLLLIFVVAGFAETHNVSIGDHFFTPQTVTIVAGDRVRWTNNGSVDHQVYGTGGLWDSGVLNPGDTYTRTFSTEGTFTYYDLLHTQATGTVQVNPFVAIEDTSWGWIRHLFQP